jgi:hypothetical protein
MRALLASILLIVLPFSGIRVICVDDAEEASVSAPGAEPEMDQQAIEDCRRICALHHPRPVPAEEDCAITVDPTSLTMLGGVAVLPAIDAAAAPFATPHVYFERLHGYVEPGLAHLSPPPKFPLA